jgi:thiamine biosynthesis lipoprotein
MGSKTTLLLSADTAAAEERLRRARGWFRAWEECLSRFRAESELSRLNRAGEAAVSPVLWSVLRAALRGARQTGGLVSPCLLTALEAAGYDRSFEHIQPAPFANAAPPAPGLDGWRAVELRPGERRVSLPAGMRLDLGGAAKGWAADRAARRLGRFAPCLVNAGGDVSASGPRPGGEPWLVAVADPRDAGRCLARLPLLRGGVATSGSVFRVWEQGGERRHHLIDPRTGQPARSDLLTVTVLAPGALEAEIAAKAVFILGSRAGLEWLEARPRLAGILVLENGHVLASPCLGEYMT